MKVGNTVTVISNHTSLHPFYKGESIKNNYFEELPLVCRVVIFKIKGVHIDLRVKALTKTSPQSQYIFFDQLGDLNISDEGIL